MQAQKSCCFPPGFYEKADLCEYYVNLEANTFDTFKVEPSLMTVFEQSHTWDELIQHFVDSYVVETDKKAVSSLRPWLYCRKAEGSGNRIGFGVPYHFEWRRTMGPQCDHTRRDRGFRICHDLSAGYHRDKGGECTASADGSNASMELLIQSIVRLVTVLLSVIWKMTDMNSTI